MSGLIVWGVLVYDRAGDDMAYRTVLGYSTAWHENETEQKPLTTTPGLGTQPSNTALSMGEVLGLLPRTEKQLKLEASPLWTGS